jgi:hypothetical protein
MTKNIKLLITFIFNPRVVVIKILLWHIQTPFIDAVVAKSTVCSITVWNTVGQCSIGRYSASANYTVLVQNMYNGLYGFWIFWGCHIDIRLKQKVFSL